MLDKLKKIIRGSNNGKVKIFHNAIDITNAVGDDGKIKIVHIGEFPNHKDGPHTVTREHCEQMAENIRNRTLNFLTDYGHESLWNTRADAAGWCDKDSVEVRDDGLYIKAPDWTPKAAQKITDKELLGLSSAYLLEYFDQYSNSLGAKCFSMGLTNTPYFETEVDHVPDFVNSQTLEDHPMAFQKETLIKLGFSEDEIQAGLTDEQIEAKVNSKISTDQTEQTEDTAAAEQPGTPSTESAPQSTEDPVANSQVVQELMTKVDQILDDGKKAHEAAINSMAENAVNERRILPVAKDQWIDLLNLDFEKYSAKLNAIPKNSVMPRPVEVNAGGNDSQDKPDRKADFVAFANARNVELGQ